MAFVYEIIPLQDLETFNISELRRSATNTPTLPSAALLASLAPLYASAWH